MGYFLEILKGKYAALSARANKMVTTHNKLTIGASGGWPGIGYFNVEGYDTAVIFLSDVTTTARQLDIQWSEDGNSLLYEEKEVLTDDGFVEIPIKANYMKAYYKNNDAVNSATSVTIKAYLKS